MQKPSKAGVSLPMTDMEDEWMVCPRHAVEYRSTYCPECEAEFDDGGPYNEPPPSARDLLNKLNLKAGTTFTETEGFTADTTKLSNPKDALGILKTPFSTIPMTVMAELGVAMLEGACKYGRHNFRSIGVRASVYVDAAMRHEAAFWEGEDIDPDSGISHITKAIASLTVLRDAMINNNWVDDRPPRPPAGWLTKLNEKVASLLKKYPNPVAPYTQVDQSWIETPTEKAAP